MSTPEKRVTPLMLLLCAIIGGGSGLLLQTYRSGVGLAPFAPPFSLAASLAVLALVLVVLARRLKAAISAERTRAVNPFHAVRLLAGAWAGQITGSLFLGFGLGLGSTIITRIAHVQVSVWVPMLSAAVAGGLLIVAGVIAENACRVPPEDGETEGGGSHTPEVTGTTQDPASAYRAPDDYS